MGARTLQRIGSEIDARGHLAPKAVAFKATMREHGVKYAFQQRDAAFGSGFASVRGRDPD
jgi:enoyl-CoA hydratase